MMNKHLISALISVSCLICTPVSADDNKSGFGFGMGSSTPERSGNSYGWGFGSTDDYDRNADGIEQSSANGGMSWGNSRDRYRRSRPFFSFGSQRGYYPPPPPYGYGHPGWGAYPPAPYPYWQQPQQPDDKTEAQ